MLRPYGQDGVGIRRGRCPPQPGYKGRVGGGPGLFASQVCNANSQARDRLRQLLVLGQEGPIPRPAFPETAQAVRNHHYPKTVVVVPIVGIVPVAISAPHVIVVIVERAPTQHAVSFQPAPTTNRAFQVVLTREVAAGCLVDWPSGLAVFFFHVPSSRPTSATRRAPWPY